LKFKLIFTKKKKIFSFWGLRNKYLTYDEKPDYSPHLKNIPILSSGPIVCVEI